MGFGLGVSVIDRRREARLGWAGAKGAFGWPGAFGTWWQADPANDLVILYLIQNSVPLEPGAIANWPRASAWARARRCRSSSGSFTTRWRRSDGPYSSTPQFLAGARPVSIRQLPQSISARRTGFNEAPSSVSE